MNLRNLNRALAGTLTVELRLTVTTPDGKSESTTATLKRNKLNKISGPGLTSKRVYDLQKTGTVSFQRDGNTFTYELLKSGDSMDDPKQASGDSPAESDSSQLSAITAAGLQNAISN